MDNELVFLTIITIIVLGFCIANIVSYLINKNHTKETEGTVISVKMPNPTTEKMRNSKWAIVTYKSCRKKLHFTKSHTSSNVSRCWKSYTSTLQHKTARNAISIFSKTYRCFCFNFYYMCVDNCL